MTVPSTFDQAGIQTGVAEPVVMPGHMLLEDLFAGDEYAMLREQIVEKGYFRDKGSKKELRIQTRALGNGKHEVMALAAVSRDPGKVEDYITTIQDFSNTGVAATNNLTQRVKQYREIYKNEGIINNAVNKIAALIGVGGRFKVKRARKGKIRKPVEQLQQALDYFVTYVNASPDSGVVTSERGMGAVIHSGVRHALVEGDWVARHHWSKTNIPDIGAFSLPMVIQTISMVNLEPVKELSGLGELWYWKPDSSLLQVLTNKNANKDIQAVVDRLVDKKMMEELKKNQRVLLTPALLLHVKHRGFATDPVGESLIVPAMLGIRYNRALTSTDLVSMENVINRLTIVQVGSADPKSPYSKADVAAARAALMQSFFEDLGPSMVIVWQGDDVKVSDVGSQDAMLDLNKRFEIAEQMIKAAVGLPDALLFGSTGQGSTAGWASVIGAAAQMQELANSFGAVLTTLGERIAKENGYEGVELIWEFDQSLMMDANEVRTQNRSDYAVGLVSIRTMLTAARRDPDAEFYQKCLERGLDPASTTFEQAFTPPQGLQGQAPGGVQGLGPGKVPGEGRTPDQQNLDVTQQSTNERPESS